MRFLSPSNSNDNMNGMNGGDFYSPVEEEDEDDEEEAMDMQDPRRQRTLPPGPALPSPMVALQFEHAQQQQQLMMVRRQRMQELEAAREGGGQGPAGFSSSRSLNLLLESEKVV